MKDEYAKKIIDELDTMNCRLMDISHFIQQFVEQPILGSELYDVFVAIGRSQSKELDDKYKQMEEDTSSYDIDSDASKSKWGNADDSS